MSDDYLVPPPELTKRQVAAARICNNPDQYKVCCGCDSIVTANVSVCPGCVAYRFETDPETIRKQAKINGDKEPEVVTREDMS